MIPSHIRHKGLEIIKNISPVDTGLTRNKGLVQNPIQNGVEYRLLYAISPYGVELDRAIGGWGGKRDRRTGILLKGWFNVRCRNALMLHFKNQGGVTNSADYQENKEFTETELLSLNGIEKIEESD